MPNRCIVDGCSDVSNADKGISLHFIPFSGDERPDKPNLMRRRQWIDFVPVETSKIGPDSQFQYLFGAF